MKTIIVNKVPFGKNGYRYMLDTKIAAAEAVLIDGYLASEVAREIGASGMSIRTWVTDYQEGKYKIENVTQITRKEITTSKVRLLDADKYRNEAEVLNKKADAAELEARELWEQEKKDMDDRFRGIA